MYGEVYLLFGMRCHKREPYERILRRTSRRNYGIYENAFLECLARNKECLVNIAHIKRNDWRFGCPYLETVIAEQFQGIIRNIPQTLLTFRLFLYYMQGFHCR